LAKDAMEIPGFENSTLEISNIILILIGGHLNEKGHFIKIKFGKKYEAAFLAKHLLLCLI